MTEQWLWLWFTFFRHNQTYRHYCEAVRAADKRAARSLERKHPRLAELYKDWGDIHAFSRQRHSQYEQWLSKRRHLFFDDVLPEPQLLAKPEALEDGFVYVKVPLGLRVKQAQAKANKLISEAYKRSPGRKASAKYRLATNIPSKKMLIATRKALNVWEMFNVEGKKPQVKQVVYAIASKTGVPGNAKLSRGWEWPNYEDFKGSDPDRETQVIRYRREAQAIIDNTLDGAFPVRQVRMA